MGKADEAQKRYAGEENNCDVRVTGARSGVSRQVEAYVPVFEGAGIAALFDAGTSLEPGDEVLRLADGRRFRVAEVLRPMSGARVSVKLERIPTEG